jgi:hypothetical protein
VWLLQKKAKAYFSANNLAFKEKTSEEDRFAKQ